MAGAVPLAGDGTTADRAAIDRTTTDQCELDEGPAKKIVDGPTRVHLLNPRPTHPPSTIRLFFPLGFFLLSFWAFLGKGSSKTPRKYFNQSPCRCRMSKTSSKISTIFFDVRCFSAMSESSKTLQKYKKRLLTKEIVSKSFYKTFDKTV
jgi:hypothetical protein